MGDSAVSPIRSVRTVCPFCSSGCGLYLTGTSHDIEGVGPSEHHPVSQGRLCARGWAAHEAWQWGPRLRTPLVREGGELRPATWDQALMAAAAGLERLRRAGGPVGVLGSGRASNEESFLALALARSALVTPHLDAPLRRQWEALLRGLGAAGAQPEPGGILPWLERSDLVVVLEDDLSISHPRVALSVLRALRRGARLVTVAWQRTPLAALATQHIALDAQAPLATLAGLRALGAVDALFRAARRASFVVAPFDADASLLEAAAAVLAEVAAGVADADRGEPLLLPLPTRANTRGALEMGVAPDRLPGRRSLDDAHVRAALAGLWGAEGCWDEGVGADEMPGAVAGLVVLGEDLPAVHPQPADVRAQLAALEHLVVVDSFLTETAAAATVVLPMAGFGETEGFLTGVEDRAQVIGALRAPPAGVRAGWEILADLGAALGCGFRPRTLAELREAIATTVPGYGLIRQSAPDEGWTVAWRGEFGSAPVKGNGEAYPEVASGAAGAAASSSPASPVHRFVLRRLGAFDWGQDALVRYSPTLRRIPASQARRYAHGLVVMSAVDAQTLGVREGWTVRLTTPQGEARAAVTLSPGVEAGLLLAPYAFREQLGAVLGASGSAEVEVQPA